MELYVCWYRDTLRAGRLEAESLCGRDFPHIFRQALGPSYPNPLLLKASFTGVKQPRQGDATHPHLRLKLHKKLSLTSTFHLGLHNLLQGKLYLYIFEKLYFSLIVWYILKEKLQNCNCFLCHIHLSTWNNP